MSKQNKGVALSQLWIGGTSERDTFSADSWITQRSTLVITQALLSLQRLGSTGLPHLSTHTYSCSIRRMVTNIGEKWDSLFLHGLFFNEFRCIVKIQFFHMVYKCLFGKGMFYYFTSNFLISKGETSGDIRNIQNISFELRTTPLTLTLRGRSDSTEI